MIIVTCAIIRNEDDEVLIVQRGELTDHPLKWEFPGGKVNPGEKETECIIREVEEELSMEIVITGQLPDVDYDYGHKQIRLIPFICDTLDELPVLSEHLAYMWLKPAKLKTVDFSEADIFVAKSYLESVGSEEQTSEPAQQHTEKPEGTDDELQNMVNRMISMKEVNWVATSAGENPAIFKKLLEFSFSPDRRLAFRSSWTLTKVCDKYPDLIIPYLGMIIESLDNIDNESTQRSFLRILSFAEMDKVDSRFHGILADHCFSALNSGFSAIAIKAYSMEILYKLAVIYPELANELALSVSMLQADSSGGILARSRIILDKLAGVAKGR
jgi:8-oxo-dGTP diphosphatase